MRDLLGQIQTGLNANLYYLSFFTSLAIPDICGALESENGEASKDKYIDWFDNYIASKYNNFLSGKDCYYLRCSLLHQGSSQHKNSNYSRILFVEPSKATTKIFHNNILKDALNIDIRIFCNDIIEGAYTWIKKYENTDPYKKNYDKFLRRYPSGLAPYIIGVPVIG